MFLADTNVVSALRRRERADPGVIAWADATQAGTIFLSAITIFEIELGALSIQRKDAAQGAILRAWIDRQVMPGFAGRILAVDEIVAQRCATLHVPDPRSERDAMIAATALVHGLTVVTRNVADFAGTGVAMHNPWQASPPTPLSRGGKD